MEKVIREQKQRKRKILHVNIDNNGGNGAFALVYYLYSIMKQKYIFDFFTMGKFIQSKEIQYIGESGGKVYSANLRKSKFIGHIKLPFIFRKYLKNNFYEIIHIHSEVAYKVLLYAWAAKKEGISKIIIHSHSSSIDGRCKFIKKILHKICKGMICNIGTDFIAISEQAAQWLFTSEIIMNKKHFFYLSNGIVVNDYKFDSNIRNKIRKYLNLDKDKLVIGHIGALKWVKNQTFLIDIIKYYTNFDENCILFLVGDGNERRTLRKKIKNLKLEDKVILLGARNDVSNLLQAFDIVVFPSFFEGVPMTLIEAQCIGVPIVASDTISKDIQINENITFLDLQAKIDVWAKEIKKNKNNHIGMNGYNNVKNSKYNIENAVQQLEIIYSRDASKLIDKG